MKFYFYSVFVLFFSFASSAQRVNEKLDIADNSREFNNYIDFEVKIVDFENSLYVNDFKTTELQIENGFHYNMNRHFTISLGINGGVILGIPYEDRLLAYINSGNISGLETFLKYYDEINFIDQSLAKTRYFIGFHPQLTLNISEKWKLLAGTALRYYFLPFFEERTFDGAHVIDDGVNFDLLGNVGLNYVLNDHFSIGLNYDRGLSYLRRVQSGDPDRSGLFVSSVRYHSLGLNASYSF